VENRQPELFSAAPGPDAAGPPRKSHRAWGLEWLTTTGGYPIFVFFGLGFLCELLALVASERYGWMSLPDKALSFAAIAFMTIPPLYSARLLRPQRLLRNAILISLVLLLLGELLDVLDEIPLVQGIPLISSGMRHDALLEHLLYLGGMSILLIAFMTALLSIHASNQREREERRRLGEEIAVRRSTEQALRQSEERLQAILSSLHKCAVIVYDRDGTRLDVFFPEEARQSMGLRAEEFIGKVSGDGLVGEGFQERREVIRQVFDTSIPAAHTLTLTFNGACLTCESTFAPMKGPDGRPVAVVAFIRDITEQQQALACQRESEIRYRALFDSSGDALFVCTLNPDGSFGKIDETNDHACRLFGYSREELQRMSPADLQDKLSTDQEGAFFARLQREKQFLVESVGKSADGRLFPVEIAVQRFELHGRPSIVASVRDITERRRRDEETSRLATAVQQTGEEIIITDANGFIQYVNPAFEHGTGYSRAEVIGKHSPHLHDLRDERISLRDVWRDVRAGNIWRGRLTSQRKDGSTYVVDITVSPVFDATGAIINYVSVRRDVSNEATLEKQLRQALKLEAVGTLAAGIAHDFKNILSLVLGYAEMARQAQNLAEARTYGGRITKAALRARGMVKQILIFSRQIEQERRPVDIRRAVDDALGLLTASLPANVELHKQLDPNAGVVLGDSTQVQQVVMNLCTNAWQSIGATGGIVDVHLRRATAEDLASRGMLPKGEWVMLVVQDTGKGIDPRTLERIFDPFFTTKPPGEGTGLGLSVVHGIITGLGGTINVQSQPGQGTRFEILLPRSLQQVPLPPVEGPPYLVGHERILVVDDEEDVGAMIAELLRGLGYEVVSCTSADEALALIAQAPHPFDAAIVDYAMPRASGADLGEELHRRGVDMPLVLATAFDDVTSLDQLRSLGFVALLPKPFSKQELADTLRRALKGEQPVDRAGPVG
jgi:PAS domain S-box-containing protein